MVLRIICCITVLIALGGKIVAEESNPQVVFFQSRLLEMLFSGVLDREIDIIDAQKDKLKSISLKRQEEMKEGVARIQVARAKGEAITLAQITADANNRAFRSINEVLLPPQEERWKQIGIQLVFSSDRSAAFFAPEMAGRLALTEEQKDELKRIFDQGEAELKKTVETLKRKREERMLEALSPEQRTKWKDAFGKPFQLGRREG